MSAIQKPYISRQVSLSPPSVLFTNFYRSPTFYKSERRQFVPSTWLAVPNIALVSTADYEAMADARRLRRGPWSSGEDGILKSLAYDPNDLNWVRISEAVATRSAKQCRERYHQNLKPSLNHDPITPEEGREIERLVAQIGRRWAEIARRMHGRSDNAVKNWWNGNQNRLKRSKRKRLTRGQSSQSAAQTHQTQEAQEAHPAPYPTPHPTGMAENLPTRSSSFSVSPGSDPRRGMSALGELPLPSPCLSEPAELEPGSNYTTSPAGFSQSRPQQRHYELPPLPNVQPCELSEGQLPALSALRQPRQVGNHIDLANRLPPLLNNQCQLPTAPSSPVQQQQSNGESGSDWRKRRPSENRDSRMDVSALVDSGHNRN